MPQSSGYRSAVGQYTGGRTKVIARTPGKDVGRSGRSTLSSYTCHTFILNRIFLDVVYLPLRNERFLSTPLYRCRLTVSLLKCVTQGLQSIGIHALQVFSLDNMCFNAGMSRSASEFSASILAMVPFKRSLT